MKFRKYSPYVAIILTYLTAVFVLRNYSIWAINDDYVLDKIINNPSDLKNSIVSFMSYFLGYTLATLFKITNFGHWLGISLTIGNILFILTTFSIIKEFNNLFTKYLSFVVLTFSIPFLILKPTYTVTSILVSFAGLFLLINQLIKNEKLSRNYLYAGIIFSYGVSIRIDSLNGSIVFLGLYTGIIIFLNKDKILFRNIIIFTVPTLIITVSQAFFNFLIMSQSSNYAEYLKFQNIRHEIFYTPAFSIMQQKVIAGEINPDQWSNVEMLLLRNWVYPDQSIYNSTTFSEAVETVEGYLGIQGVLNSDFRTTLNTIQYYLQDVNFFFFLSIFLLFFTVAFSRQIKKSMLLNLSLFTSYFIGFYYAAAVLRLPIRVTLPYLLILSILFIYNWELTGIRQNFKFMKGNWFMVITILLIFIFNSFSIFGFKKIFEDNKNKLIWSAQRDLEISNFDKNAIFVSTISFLPISNSGPFIGKFNSEFVTQILDWSTFSPSWKMNALALNLNPKNIYLDIAKTKNVYFIGSSDLSDLADMYMNDHNILRGEKCLMEKLSGTDDAGIYTYQALENSC